MMQRNKTFTSEYDVLFAQNMQHTAHFVGMRALTHATPDFLDGPHFAGLAFGLQGVGASGLEAVAKLGAVIVHFGLAQSVTF